MMLSTELVNLAERTSDNRQTDGEQHNMTMTQSCVKRLPKPLQNEAIVRILCREPSSK